MSMKTALLLALIGFCCLTSAAAHAQQQTGDGPTIVVVNYYAKPGKEQDVLSIRLSANDVLEKNGVTRGRVLTRVGSSRETKHADNPDVVWEAEFSDTASLKRYEDIADKNPDFLAARKKMDTTATRAPFERRYYQLRSDR